MSCGVHAWELVREARRAGVLIELGFASGTLRVRAKSQPSDELIEHIRQHKREILTFLRAKAKAEETEKGMAETAGGKRRKLPKRKLRYRRNNRGNEAVVVPAGDMARGER
jgi:hypothetical protein